MTPPRHVQPPDAPSVLWREALDVAIRPCRHLKRIAVLAETDSTQDAARRMTAVAGDVIVAARQTSGRGRLGRRWIDTGDAGIAVSVVLRRAAGERLAVAAAVGAARALESVLRRPLGIKWPNDIVASGRKLAGILIEQADATAIIGIGINVRQRHWPPELDGRAVSLSQLGGDVDRLAVLQALLPALDAALALDDAAVQAEYAARDVLLGTVAVFRMGEDLIRGEVLSVDPLRGLEVRTGSGRVHLPAAVASLVDASAQSR
jgi:BirA family biotin operon repressor/biotin-[acetyl-CoA-carboxylase] ligase